MDYLKNIPQNTPVSLKETLKIHEGQLLSMALSQVDNAQVVGFAVSAGEDIGEEAYLGDALYLVLTGRTKINRGDAEFEVSAGEAAAVPAKESHALAFPVDSTYIQITIFK